MADWKDFDPLVVPMVPGCSAAVAREAVKDAVAEFCDRSNIWTVDLDSMPMLVGIAEVDLSPPTGSRVIRLEEVKLNGMPLAPTSPRELDILAPTWTEYPNGQPTHFWVADDGANRLLHLWPTPNETSLSALYVRAVLKPTSTADGVPDWLFEEWRHPVASGALKKLCATPGKEWTNPDLAAYHAMLFSEGIGRATYALNTGGTTKPLRIQGRRFGRYD